MTDRVLMMSGGFRICVLHLVLVTGFILSCFCIVYRLCCLDVSDAKGFVATYSPSTLIGPVKVALIGYRTVDKPDLDLTESSSSRSEDSRSNHTQLRHSSK